MMMGTWEVLKTTELHFLSDLSSPPVYFFFWKSTAHLDCQKIWYMTIRSSVGFMSDAKNIDEPLAAPAVIDKRPLIRSVCCWRHIWCGWNYRPKSRHLFDLEFTGYLGVQIHDCPDSKMRRYHVGKIFFKRMMFHKYVVDLSSDIFLWNKKVQISLL